MVSKPHFKPPAALLYSAAYQSSHAAASHDDPAMVGWYPSSQSADADLIDELPLIRERNIDLERNNGYVAGANQVFKDNIVGHQLRLNPGPVLQLLEWDADQGEEWGREVRAQFESWANSPVEIDAAKDLNLRGLTIQALGAWFLTGNALALPIWRPREGCRWNTRIQTVEAHRLESPPFFQSYTRSMRGGKEIDRDGAPVAYWFRKTQPGDERFDPIGTATDPFQFRRVPAFYPWGRRRVIHLFDKERSGQSVGKPIVAAIMREFRMATQYPRVELQATIANSLVAGVLESNLDGETNNNIFNSYQDRNDSNRSGAEAYWKDAMDGARRSATLKPGATLALPLGAKFVGFTPNRPNNSFDKFMNSVLHNIGAGLNIPYELLTKDFTQTNYSSARAAMLEAWRHFLSKRAWLEENWLNPIYELWLEEAVNAGVVTAPGFYDSRYAYCATRKWTMTGRGWVDPSKEAQGAQVRMDSRISSLAQECAEQGNDWMEVIDQIKIIEDYANEKGVQLYAAASQGAGVAGAVDLAAANVDGTDPNPNDNTGQQDQQAA